MRAGLPTTGRRGRTSSVTFPAAVARSAAAILLMLGGPAARRARAAGTEAERVQSMRVDVRGPVAHVTVTRVLNCRGAAREGGALHGSTQFPEEGRDLVLDLALPARSELLTVAVADGAHRFRELHALTGRASTRDGGLNGNGTAAYLEALRGTGVTPWEVPFDDEARFRFRTTCPRETTNKPRRLRYQFSVLLELYRGAGRVAFPAAAELSPPSTRVEVHVSWPGAIADIAIGGAAHPIVGGGVPAATEVVSMRSAWNIAVTPRRPPAAEPGQPWRVMALGALGGGRSNKSAENNAGKIPRTNSGGPLLAYAVGATDGARQPLPDRVLFLMDRSRSVGPGGLEAERDTAKKILDALPPSTRFDAIFFDRAQQFLFPTTRSATREAITALEEEMVPARMANGTDFPAALRATADLLRRNSADFSPRCLLVILTDGAVGIPALGGQLALLAGAAPKAELMVAAISVRPHDDPEVSQEERRVLRGVAAAASLGGVERSLRVGDLADAVPALLATLLVGGDVYAVGLRDGPRGEFAEVLEPATGVSGVLPLGKAAAATAADQPHFVTYRGAPRPLPLRPLSVDARWLQPLLRTNGPVLPTSGTPSASSLPHGWLLVEPGAAALVEPVIRPSAAAPPPDTTPRGYMERSVVRDALSLAFTPRARACYLNRTAATAADRDLTGRVRLALDLVRGEVAAVRLGTSSLAHAGIETCLRDAAFAIEVPRAYRNDEAVTAVLNLVFRPRTPDRRAGVALENPSLSHDLDVIIEAALKERDGGISTGSTEARDAGVDATKKAADAQ